MGSRFNNVNGVRSHGHANSKFNSFGLLDPATVATNGTASVYINTTTTPQTSGANLPHQYTVRGRPYNGDSRTNANFGFGSILNNNNANIANRAFNVLYTYPPAVYDLDLRKFRGVQTPYQRYKYPYRYLHGYPYNVSYSDSQQRSGLIPYPNPTAYPYFSGVRPDGRTYPNDYPDQYAYPYNFPYGYPNTAPYGNPYSAINGLPFTPLNNYPLAFFNGYPYSVLEGYPYSSPECAPYIDCGQTYSNPNDCRSCISASGGSNHCANQICGPAIL